MFTPLLEGQILDVTKYRPSRVILMPHHWIKHVVSNSSSLTSDHDSVSVSGDASSEPTSIEYVRAKLSMRCT